MADGPAAGLELIDAIAASGDLRDYYLMWSARADLLRRLGRWSEAAESYRAALARVEGHTDVVPYGSVNGRLTANVKVRKPGDTMTLADLFTWTNAAVYDDIGARTIDAPHRELQRRFSDLQMQIVALPAVFADQLDLPRETQALARYNLIKLDARLDRAVAAAGDEGTRAHLIDLRVRVRGILHAQNIRSI